MCIIAIKPAGVAKPTAEQFKAMCDTNRNGFGYMTWSKERGLQVYKTMSEADYMKHVEKIPDEQPVVYHMRIATHGSVQKKNCHPFVDATKKWGFAHNGILSIHNEGDMTDSETFFKRIAMPLIYAGIKPKSKPFDKMVDCIIGSSKFAFLNDEGMLFYYGDFIKEKGLLFSNTSYKPRVFTAWNGGSSLTGCSSRPYGGYYWGDYSRFAKYAQGKFEKVEPKQEQEKQAEHLDLNDKEYDDLCDFLQDMANMDTLHIPLNIDQILLRCTYKFPKMKTNNDDAVDYIVEACELMGLTFDYDEEEEVVEEEKQLSIC